MIKNNYIIETFDKKHIHFGGDIYISDFNTEYIENNISIAARIESDFRWEKKLLKKGANNKLCRN